MESMCGIFHIYNSIYIIGITQTKRDSRFFSNQIKNVMCITLSYLQNIYLQLETLIFRKIYVVLAKYHLCLFT